MMTLYGFALWLTVLSLYGNVRHDEYFSSLMNTTTIIPPWNDTIRSTSEIQISHDHNSPLKTINTNNDNTVVWVQIMQHIDLQSINLITDWPVEYVNCSRPILYYLPQCIIRELRVSTMSCTNSTSRTRQNTKCVTDRLYMCSLGLSLPDNGVEFNYSVSTGRPTLNVVNFHSFSIELVNSL